MLENLARVWERPEPPQQQEEMGFFTDTTLCIGCKACEVACKQWNQLPADCFHWTGNSYDNTTMLSDTTWRHVAFIEQLGHEVKRDRWLMMSDVCKHCVQAPCQEACPTGSIIYNEFGNVYVQQDICNGCGYCVAADRKSTRLNSSHSQISYAVFCLKKKKKKHNMISHFIATTLSSYQTN